MDPELMHIVQQALSSFLIPNPHVHTNQTGDKEAAFAIHNRIADDIWGDTLDLHEMGLEGQEPEATAKLRRLVRETEPALWRLVTQGDPLITKCVRTCVRA